MTLQKLSPIERVLRAASGMPPDAARQVLMLICRNGMAAPASEPSEGAKHYAKRVPSINRMDRSCRRCFGYIRHETLRNIERYFRQNPHAIAGAETSDEPKPSSLAARLTFDKSDFAEELLAALREDLIMALGLAGQQASDELGFDDPWKLPARVAIDYLDTRANLMSNVPDDVHTEIMQTIQEGLDLGESRKELMSRVAQKFMDITEARSQTIAHTETASAFNFARDKAMRDAGVSFKKWLHSQSPLIKEPRPTHVDADGVIVPINEPFDVAGVKFMYPTDSSLGAGPEDIINCHCVSIATSGPEE